MITLEDLYLSIRRCISRALIGRTFTFGIILIFPSYSLLATILVMNLSSYMDWILS